MKEQIEEMARKICCNHYNGDCVGGECICQYECIYAVYANRLYNAGYRKQKDGEWIEKSEDQEEYYEYTYKCSICGHWAIIADEGDSNFCPNCGSKMRGGA